MVLTKFLILVAGVIGVVAFFQPLATIDAPEFRATMTGRDVLEGIDLAHQLKRQVDDGTLDAPPGPEARVVLDNFDDAISAVRVFLVVMFVPAVVLLLVGSVAVLRGRLGRVGGGLALSFGLVGALVAGVVMAAFATAKMREIGGSAGLAVHLALAAGICGILGGLLALVVPERA